MKKPLPKPLCNAPKMGSTYYYFYSLGALYQATWQGGKEDWQRLDSGRIFGTRDDGNDWIKYFENQLLKAKQSNH